MIRLSQMDVTRCDCLDVYADLTKNWHSLSLTESSLGCDVSRHAADYLKFWANCVCASHSDLERGVLEEPFRSAAQLLYRSSSRENAVFLWFDNSSLRSRLTSSSICSRFTSLDWSSNVPHNTLIL